MHKMIIAQALLRGVDTESKCAEQQRPQLNTLAAGHLPSARGVETIRLFALFRAKELRSYDRDLCSAAQFHDCGLIIAALCKSFLANLFIRISRPIDEQTSRSGIRLRQILRHSHPDRRATRPVSIQHEKLPLLTSHLSAARRGANPSLTRPVEFPASPEIKRGANEAKRECLLSYDLPQRKSSLPTGSAAPSGSSLRQAENRQNGNL